MTTQSQNHEVFVVAKRCGDEMHVDDFIGRCLNVPAGLAVHQQHCGLLAGFRTRGIWIKASVGLEI